jgi:hypothetical protein
MGCNVRAFETRGKLGSAMLRLAHLLAVTVAWVPR